jgi:hypothetical protein
MILIPQALNAVISLSADNLPTARIVPTRIDIGIPKIIADGMRLNIILRRTQMETEFRMRNPASITIWLINMIKEITANPTSVKGKSSAIIYLSKIFIRLSLRGHYTKLFLSVNRR